MTNSYPSGSPGVPDSSMPTGAPGFVPRRSSYASVVAGAASGASQSYQQPTRSGAFSHLLNQHTDFSYDPSYPNFGGHSRHDNRGFDMDYSTNGGSQRPGSWGRGGQLSVFSSAFGLLMNGPGYGGFGHVDHFFVPSYLKGSKYVQKLEEAHKAKISAHKDGHSAQSSQPGSLSTSASSMNLPNKMAPSHRGMTYDLIEKAPPAEDENLPPLPSKWNNQDKYGGLEVLSDGQEVKFSGPKSERDRDHEACAIRADHPMPPQCGIYYFEVTIISRKREESSIGIGFSSKGVSLARLPGWEPESWAYHGDDGHSFCCQSSGKHYGPPFTAGDVIGCGVNFRTGSAFFTKNGDHLGVAFREIKGKLYPSVGMKRAGEHVRVNFGQSPFVFDIDGMMSCACKWVFSAAMDITNDIDDAADAPQPAVQNFTVSPPNGDAIPNSPSVANGSTENGNRDSDGRTTQAAWNRSARQNVRNIANSSALPNGFTSLDGSAPSSISIIDFPISLPTFNIHVDQPRNPTRRRWLLDVSALVQNDLSPRMIQEIQEEAQADIEDFRNRTAATQERARAARAAVNLRMEAEEVNFPAMARVRRQVFNSRLSSEGLEIEEGAAEANVSIPDVYSATEASSSPPPLIPSGRFFEEFHQARLEETSADDENSRLNTAATRARVALANAQMDELLRSRLIESTPEERRAARQRDSVPSVSQQLLGLLTASAADEESIEASLSEPGLIRMSEAAVYAEQIRAQTNSLIQREQSQINQEIEATSTSKLAPPLNERELIQSLVLQFITHDGYVETARAFADEVHMEKKALSLDPNAVINGFDVKEDEDAGHRQRIRAAVLDGDVEKALKYTNAYYPDVLKDNEHVYFRLRCRKFIEMIRQGAEMHNSSSSNGTKKSNGHHGDWYDDIINQEMDVDDHHSQNHHWDRMDTEETPGNQMEYQRLLQETLAYGQVLQAEFKDDPRKEVMKALEEAFALMAYEDPLNAKEVSHLLNPSGRVAVAEELNSAILLSLGKSSSAALEQLYQQTTVLLEDLRETGGPGAFVNIDDFTKLSKIGLDYSNS